MGRLAPDGKLPIPKKKIINDMRVVKIFGIILLLCSKSFAQNIDTSKLLLNSKMMLVNYLEKYEELDYYEAYLHYNPKVVFINSTGFDSNYIFYKIRIKDTLAFRRKIDSNKTQLVHFFMLKNEDVFFAFNSINEKVYKLNGEGYDNLYEFMNIVISYYNVVRNHEIEYGKKLSRKNFYKYFSIEGFDFKQNNIRTKKLL